MSKNSGRNHKKDQHKKFVQRTQPSEVKVQHNREPLRLTSTFKLSKQSKRLLAACDGSKHSDLLYLLKQAERDEMSFKNRRESSKKETSDES